EADAPRGYILIRYKGKALGFVKNIGNRANNLYPQEWRIRSGYLTEQVSVVV
ncbi:MAG: rRNA cytosine-C5-methyltransferase, partial [Bacteroidetes bacterium]|nr:rRNA cytosine-C5-methyltransferase [Candidatus Gallipaludibacter merdavium]